MRQGVVRPAVHDSPETLALLPRGSHRDAQRLLQVLVELRAAYENLTENAGARPCGSTTGVPRSL